LKIAGTTDLAGLDLALRWTRRRGKQASIGSGAKWLAAVVIATALAAAAFGAPFDIPRIENGDWDKAFRVNLLVPLDTLLRPPEVFSAAARLGWNDDGLLVRVSVAGPVTCVAADGDEIWKGDSVELYLSPDAASRERCQWVLAPHPDPEITELRTRFHDHRDSPDLRRRSAAVRGECRRTSAGYRVDALLPWSALGIEPAAGREVMCQIMVSDAPGDGSGQDRLWWYPMAGAYSDSRKMQRLRLADVAGPPVRLRGASRLDLRNKRATIDVLAPVSLAGTRVHVGVGMGATLAAAGDGYAHATLDAALPNLREIELLVADQVAEVVPLLLPASVRGTRRGSLEIALKDGLPDIPAACRVKRRTSGGEWADCQADAPLTAGLLYEYAVSREDPAACDYFCAGVEVPPVDRRGKALLIGDTALAEALAPEIDRLLRDWAGDGWHAVQASVAATATPVAVKALIEKRSADAVLLLGDVPVPYSGVLCVDGHPDHRGVYPADVFYATGGTGWTDTEANFTNAPPSRQNVPGDGRFDQGRIPGSVVRAVGRIDFRDLPVFEEAGIDMYRRYLDRLHAYRNGNLAVEARGWVQDGFGSRPFAYSGWQNLTTLLGPDHVADGIWPNFPPEMQLWFYGCGPGGPDVMKGFGQTGDFVRQPLNAVFALLFGSYFGDWVLANNLMRGALAADGGPLTCGWAGMPHWYLHPMGMGATIGECLVLTQNNDSTVYQPAGPHARGVHIALLGDPTLRMHRVSPPGTVQARADGDGVRLDWQPSLHDGGRYHVYRAGDELGPYERLTTEPLGTCEYRDTSPVADSWYMVRTVALQRTPTGSYENMSQGVMTCVTDRIER
jgi:hypothetical protein